MFFLSVHVLFKYAVAKKEVPVTASPVVIDVAGDGIGLPKGWQNLRAQNAVERISDLRAWWQQVDQMTVIPKSALKVALLTGMRPSEVIGLRWDQVNLDAGKVANVLIADGAGNSMLIIGAQLVDMDASNFLF